jgi:hypothetical protein
MPTLLKKSALGMTALAVAFCLFFQCSKHDPAFATINPFAEDPYDAVGSFGIQFVLFCALLSLLRASRPYPQDSPLKAQEALLALAQLMIPLVVAVTTVADVIAMFRHLSMWQSSVAGYELLGMAAGLLLCAALAGWLLLRSARALSLPQIRFTWPKAIAIPAAALLILAIYPEALRNNLPGELFTVVAGMTLLFVPTWAIGTVLIPVAPHTHLDLIDDLAALYRALIAKMPALRPISLSLERTLNRPTLRAWLDGFSPRKHRWSLAAIVGILIGVLLLLAELNDGGSPVPFQRVFLVAAVYVGLESAGVLMGYALLSKPLGLFRSSVR